MNHTINGTAADSCSQGKTVANPKHFCPKGSLGGLATEMIRGLPTILILSAIGFIGWWGHQHEWKLSKFSAMTGHVRPFDDWCAAHGVPDSVCVECDESRLPRPMSHGWCDLHGIPECPLCHPELAQLAKTPVVGPADLVRTKQSLDFAKRPVNNPVCDTHHRRIQFTDIATVDKAGVVVEPVRTGPVTEYVAMPGEIGFDESRLARLSSRAAGTVWRVFRLPGDTVRAGDALALIDAADAGRAKAELLQAAALLELRSQTLAGLKSAVGAVADARIREAESAMRETGIRLEAARQSLVNMGLPLDEADIRITTTELLRQRIQFLGIPADDSKLLDPARTTFNLLPIISPCGGKIVSKTVIPGEAVDASRVLFEVADTTRWWLTLDSRTEDAGKLRIGQPVRFIPDSGGEELAGRLSWIAAQADPKTRTIKGRADLPDPDGRQRANTFGAGRVILREEPRAIVVPPDAMHWDGCCHVVFVRDRDYLKPGSPKVFHVRKVRIGARDEKGIEIAAGLLTGELIVTKGGGLILTELLRANLGDGCACCHVK